LVYNIDMGQDIKYLLALGSDGQIGAKTFAKILAVFPNPKELWKINQQEMLNRGLPEKVVKIIDKIKSKISLDDVLDNLKKLKINFVTFKDKKYPQLLLEIPDKPIILYYRGDLDDSSQLSIAVVGSRKYSPYGERVTEQISSECAQAGLAIVSGLALGIDGCAHKSTLKVKGKTIAVLGNGLDQIYPYSHKHLGEEIIASGGALLSEFPPGIPALKYNFPIRNRIIAGMTLGTVIVEGALKSGSLITAQCAIEYNREVFAVPGNIYSQISAAPNQLIKHGAKLITETRDILEELSLDVRLKHEQAKKVIPESKEEVLILKYLSHDESTHIDKLKILTKLDIATLNAKMTLMEIRGKVKNIGAGNYIIK